MSSLYKKSGGVFYIQLSPSEHAARPKISTGTRTKRDAADFKRNIENLIQARRTGSTLSAATMDWLQGLPESVYSRLIQLNLAESKNTAVDIKVLDWAADFVEAKKKSPYIAKATYLKYLATYRKMKAYFRGETLGDVSPALAERFRNYLKEVCGLTENTVSKHICQTKEMFKAAVKNEMIRKNPFDGQRVNVRPNPERFFYVTPELAKEVLEACPGAEWKLIFALARFGGLRIPSELAGLRWQDIHFDKDMFTVHATKTAHHEGGGVRQVPLFSELKPLLLQAFEEAPDGAEYVISDIHRKSNVGVHFRRLLLRAGIKPWPKIWQNCRSTRETELFRITGGNIKAVCNWIGNSETVALKHYSQVTAADMQQAAAVSVLEEAKEKISVSDDLGRVHNRVHDRAETDGNAEKHNSAKDDITPTEYSPLQAVSACCKTLQNHNLWAVQDLNQKPQSVTSKELTANQENRGVQDRVHNSAFSQIISDFKRIWPGLPQTAKQEIIDFIIYDSGGEKGNKLK